MKQASFGLLISYRGSLIQACFIFLGFAPVPSLFFAETNNPIFLGMKEPTIPSDEGALSGSERVFVSPPFASDVCDTTKTECRICRAHGRCARDLSLAL
jgi:hypothetical protein